MRKTYKNIREIIKMHVINNSKEYIIISLIFVIGILLGVLFINNIQEEQGLEITNYINNFIEKFKETENLDSNKLLKTSISQNITLALAIWFFGTTIIGIPIVFGITLYKGFCLGYTISAITATLGVQKGVFFIFGGLVLQNILFIPATIALTVSGFKLYKSIMKNKRRENIKLEIIRHTIFSIIMLIILLIASTIEIFISNNILQYIVKYF